MGPMLNNYFVAGGLYFFFNSSDRPGTQKAFDLARAAGPRVAVYTVPKNPGPWDRIGLVGHRSRSEILKDLAGSTAPLAIDFLREELDRRDVAYLKAGRLTVPPQAVAA